LLVIAPVIAFYVLYDWHKMVGHGGRLGAESANRETVRDLAVGRWIAPSRASCAGRRASG
jgi:hypothetical protein